jgi:hypothetical protein
VNLYVATKDSIRVRGLRTVRPVRPHLGPRGLRTNAVWLSAHRIWYYGEKRDGYDGEIQTMDVSPRGILLS